MKNTFFNFIKLTLALVLFLQVGEVSGQISAVVSGVTITVTGTSQTTYPTPGATSCPTSAFTGNGYWSAGTTEALTYTFSTPVISAKVFYTAVNTLSSGVGDSGTISINGGGTLTISNPCNVTISGAIITGSAPSPVSFCDVNITVTSSQPFTTLTIKNTGGKSGWVQGNPNTFSVTPCYAGSTAPTLSATTINNSSCATGYINLNSLVTSTLPSGASLKWYTSTARTTEVTTPTAVGVSGTYYAFYVDTVNNCYSPASAAVTATYTACPLNISSVCPATTVDLATRVTGTAPTGYTYTYHSATPATTGNKLANGSVVSTSGTYYVATYFAGQDCYTATSRPMVVTITNCCATIAPPTFN